MWKRVEAELEVEEEDCMTKVKAGLRTRLLSQGERTMEK
jgi:hypothetical protein